MSPRLLLFPTLAMILACAGLTETDDTASTGTNAGKADDDAEKIEQTDACKQYIECLTETAPEAVGPLISSYGEDGSCWENESSAEACDEACAEAVANAHQTFPDAEACDDGSEVPIEPETTDWVFTTTNHDCDDDPYVSLYEGRLSLDDDDRLEWAGRISIDANEYRYELDANFECTLNGAQFECEPLQTDMISENDTTFTFSGEFSRSDRASGTMGFSLDSPRVNCESAMDGEPD